ncbi:S41 family peptidase [Pedobacter sp. B4-66]|uniref:S41 family peptidase n=1 Tax=Pedobacter sp. B4-66 TaxID=2817280 RepID=UPI001BD9E399|nr:S41 family peptidase [Pedobacter sp. B4-66]
MKKTIILILFALISSTSFSQILSKADFIEDLEFLKKTLPIKHTNLFAKIDSSQFENKVDQVSMRSNGFDQNRFIVELFKLTKSIGDEHTFIEVDFTKILPIQFELFKEGLFIVGIDSANASVLNSKLESINGHPVSEVLTRFKEIIQYENPSYFDDRLLQHLNNPVLLNGLELIDSDSIATFTLSNSNGQTQKISLKPVAGKDVAKLNLTRSGKSLLSHKKSSNYWFDYDADKKILYFNYSECREHQQYSFAKFSEELFPIIDEQKAEKIILDLRYNGGGNSAILNPFIEKISASYLNKKGKFFVLIGKKTFSSAVMNAVELKRNSNAIFIGEATSGNINHYGEVRGFSLPKSKIVVAYSTRYWERWKGKKGPLKPDINMKYSIKNYIDGKDEALMKI